MSSPQHSTSATAGKSKNLIVLALVVIMSTLGAALLVFDFKNDCPAPEIVEDQSNDTAQPRCDNSLVAVPKPKFIPPIPDLLRSSVVATSGLTLTRVSDNSITAEEQHLEHAYSRRQAWNANETILDLGSNLLDVQTGELLPAPKLSTARNWSNLNPELMIGIRYNPQPNELAWFDLNLGTFTTVHRFEDYTNCSFGKAEGNISIDDTKVALICTEISNNQLAVISFDIYSKQVLGTLKAKKNINWASFDHSGDYILIENKQSNDPSPELIRYSAQLSDAVVLDTRPTHGDFGIDDHGNSVYVFIQEDRIYSVRLADRAKVMIATGNGQQSLGHGHISCRNINRPGWCYFSSYGGGRLGAFRLGSAGPISEDLLEINKKFVKGPKAYEHWGFHFSNYDTYRSQPQISASPSGKQIIFTSNWGSVENPAEEYVISTIN